MPASPSPFPLRFFHQLAAKTVTAVAILAFVVVVQSSEPDSTELAGNESSTDKYRLVWTGGDPSNSAIFAWNQIEVPAAKVHYGPEDHGRHPDRYPHSIDPQRLQTYDGMTNCFARFTDLEPDTVYYFCLEDSQGVSRRFQFLTAPAKPKSFTFISGGDSRNFREPRIAANRICARLRPLFVAFTGDMINRDTAEEWQAWLDDWQHTLSPDGHLVPIVPHRGNHESREESLPSLFDTPKDVYFAFPIGGDLLRYYVLNSQIPATGRQEKWLDADLDKHSESAVHLVVGYHKPMRPHVSAKGEGANPMNWADNFYAHGVDLSLESDSHVMKRTEPLRPDPKGTEGFSAAPDDPKATVYIGEGCWGAPLRKADDAKPWTRDLASFNGIDWIQVTPQAMEVKTIRVDESARVAPIDPAHPFTDPEGLVLWEAKGGSILTIPGD